MSAERGWRQAPGAPPFGRVPLPEPKRSPSWYAGFFTGRVLGVLLFGAVQATVVWVALTQAAALGWLPDTPRFVPVLVGWWAVVVARVVDRALFTSPDR